MKVLLSHQMMEREVKRAQLETITEDSSRTDRCAFWEGGRERNFDEKGCSHFGFNHARC